MGAGVGAGGLLLTCCYKSEQCGLFLFYSFFNDFTNVLTGALKVLL